MNNQQLRFIVRTTISFILLLFLSLSSFADPPSRVARISYLYGSVSFSPAGSDQNNWVNATLNRPFVPGDYLWAGDNARAEMQLDTARLRMGSQTNIDMVNLDNKLAQFQLLEGTLCLHVKAVSENPSTYEIDTPNLAFSVNQPGTYRINVNSNSTTVMVYGGSADVYGDNNAYEIAANESYQFDGTDLNQIQHTNVAMNDLNNDFDQWCLASPTPPSSSIYASQKIVGVEDLPQYGTWRSDQKYGNIWVPNDVPDGWAPYRVGHWEWIAPWGWTWIDDEPWGFAPFHYGRWVLIYEEWAWVPGPIYVEPVYAPAFVVFVDFGGVSIGVYGSEFGDYVSWVPLGPGDVYIPPYEVTINYFNNINITNTTIINVNNINVYYNNPNVIYPYTYIEKAAALSTITKADFIKAQPVMKNLLPVSSVPVNIKPANIQEIKPTPASLVGRAKPTNIKPAPAVLNRPTIIKTLPTDLNIKNRLAPITPVTPSTPITPIQPINKPNKPIKPIQPKPQPKPIEPVVQPVKPIEPEKPIQPVVKPFQPVVEPIKPAPIKPIGPVKPVKPIKPVHPLEPSQPVSPIEPSPAPQPVAPIPKPTPVTPRPRPIKPIPEPITPVQPATPIQPSQLEPSEQIKSQPSTIQPLPKPIGPQPKESLRPIPAAPQSIEQQSQQLEQQAQPQRIVKEPQQLPLYQYQPEERRVTPREPEERIKPVESNGSEGRIVAPPPTSSPVIAPPPAAAPVIAPIEQAAPVVAPPQPAPVVVTPQQPPVPVIAPQAPPAPVVIAPQQPPAPVAAPPVVIKQEVTTIEKAPPGIVNRPEKPLKGE